MIKILYINILIELKIFLYLKHFFYNDVQFPYAFKNINVYKIGSINY